VTRKRVVLAILASPVTAVNKNLPLPLPLHFCKHHHLLLLLISRGFRGRGLDTVRQLLAAGVLSLGLRVGSLDA
jgi:hypothetical protein